MEQLLCYRWLVCARADLLSGIIMSKVRQVPELCFPECWTATCPDAKRTSQCGVSVTRHRFQLREALLLNLRVLLPAFFVPQPCLESR